MPDAARSRSPLAPSAGIPPVLGTGGAFASSAHEQDGTLFVALELSLSHWLVAVSAPDASKVGKHRVPACDGPALLALLDRLRRQAEARCGGVVGIVSIQEAGRDGFWVHRLLEAHGVQSQVVDPASIAVNRRSRRAKTDRIDAEGLRRTLMAWSRGERQVCSMVRPPTREAEDARRLTREREALVAERTRHANRIKGLLATQGVFGFEPTWQARRARLDELRTPEGPRLPPQLMAEILRQIERLEPTMRQIASVEAERDAALAAECQAEDQAGAALASPEGLAPAAPVLPPSAAPPRATARETFGSSARDGAGARLLRLKGIGPETASVLRLEAFHRSFGNRREIAAYAGLTPTPWKSGGLDTEQGISKSGNARLRRTMVQVAGTALPSLPPADRCAMVLAAQPATKCPERLVSRARRRWTRPDQAHRDRGAGAQASDRALEARHPGDRARRRRAEGRKGRLSGR